MSSREQQRRKSKQPKTVTFGINEWLKLASWFWNGKNFLWEFDPGSGWTLAACLTHASRTKHFTWFPSGMIVLWLSGGRVSNAWITCLTQGDNSRKRLLIPHNTFGRHLLNVKDFIAFRWARVWLAGWRGNGPPRRRSVAGLRGWTATLGLRHGPDSYGRQQWGILGNGRKPDPATPREGRRLSGCKLLFSGTKQVTVPEE